MKEHSSDKQNVVSTDSLQHSSFITTKQHWQAPRLHEMDSSETNSGLLTHDDGASFS